MGDFHVRKIKDAHDRRQMYQHAIRDIEAFEHMLQEKMFEEGDLWIGAEQELCVVDQYQDPTTSALQLLDKINDEHYTNELALFNMEINLDPLPLQGSSFSTMEKQLLQLLQKGHDIACAQDENIVMSGILPTLTYQHLQPKNMTPIARYQTLSDAMSEIRGSKFEVYMQGVDDLILSLGSVLFEACNTSFQLHLQIKPDEFVNQHNWSQMIAGPVLAACVNSPLLFGNELWAETRIALFKQSLDTRSSQKFMRMKLPRVYFGRGWMQDSPAELWKNDIMRFPLVLTSDNLENAHEVLNRGEIPDLRGIRLHNGTTYTWNRMCYGFSKKKPHLRIECRYIPSGPTAIDEMANFAFWIGLMRCEPEGGNEFWKNQSFKAVKNNFVQAARSGLNTVFSWYEKNISAKELLLDQLLPMAEKGLKESGIDDMDIQKYLQVIERRIQTENTGSEWTIRNFRRLSKSFGETVTEKELVRQMIIFQKENTPIYEWEDMQASLYSPALQNPTVEQLMTTDIYSVNETDSIELVESILKWNDIHHLPVENHVGDLVGMITDGLLDRLSSEREKKCFARDIMLTELVTLQSTDSIDHAKSIIDKRKINGLPVTYQNKLVGMITTTDIQKMEYLD